MTTIVATRTAIYSDSGCNAETNFLTRKLFRVEPRKGTRYLVGVAGDLDVALRMVAVLRANTLDDCADRPIDGVPAEEKDDHGVIVVTEDKRIFILGARMVPTEVLGYYAAIGTGAPYALAALDFGKSPREAVEYACTRDHESSLPVAVLTFRTKQP